MNENEEAPKDMWTEHRKKVEKGPERLVLFKLKIFRKIK